MFAVALLKNNRTIGLKNFSTYLEFRRIAMNREIDLLAIFKTKSNDKRDTLIDSIRYPAN